MKGHKCLQNQILPVDNQEFTVRWISFETGAQASEFELSYSDGFSLKKN